MSACYAGREIASGGGYVRAVEVVITCDGGFKKPGCQPGVATYACLVRRGGQVVHREYGVVCQGRSAHNLVAEYGAVVAALRWLLRAGLPEAVRIEIRSDCRFVVDRLNGQCTVRRKRGFVMLHGAASRSAETLRRRGHQVVFLHVPRSEVAEAHLLCARVYRRALRVRLRADGAATRSRIKGFLARSMVREPSGDQDAPASSPRAME